MNTSKDISDFLDKNITSIVSTSIVDLEININPDNKVKMVLECPEKYMHRVRPYIANGALKINTEGSFSLHSPLVVKVYLKTLEEINISGSGNVKGYFKGDSLKIKSSGASDIELEGEVSSLDVTISGTGNANLRNLEVKKLNLNLSGVSNAQVNVEKYCSVKISGVGNATVFGDPEVLKESISGLGKVKKAGKIKSVSLKSVSNNRLGEKKEIFNNISEKIRNRIKNNEVQIEPTQNYSINKKVMEHAKLWEEIKNNPKYLLDRAEIAEMELYKYNEPKHTAPTPAEVKISKAQALSKKIKSML